MGTAWSIRGRQPKWGGGGKLSHARNSPTWSGPAPGAVVGQQMWWWGSRDGDTAEEDSVCFCSVGGGSGELTLTRTVQGWPPSFPDGMVWRGGQSVGLRVLQGP